MKGIIIAGGFGTRLRPLTYSRPKHLLPVGNRPFLEYQVALLRAHGVTEIVFATNYFAFFASQSSSANLLFAGSGYLSQGDLYKWGAIYTAACILIYLVIGTPWLLLVIR